MFIYLKLANWFCRVSNSFLAQFAKVTELIEFEQLINLFKKFIFRVKICSCFAHDLLISAVSAETKRHLTVTNNIS